MASVGKVVVQIEARIGALEAGLAKAELAIRKSGDRMAEAQNTLTKKFERSWVEISSKVAIYSNALDLVGKTMKTISSLGRAFDDSLTPDQSLEAIAELRSDLEALPLGLGSVVSGLEVVINQVTGLGDQFERLMEIERTLSEQTGIIKKTRVVRQSRVEELKLLELRLDLLKSEDKLEAGANLNREQANQEQQRALDALADRHEEIYKLREPTVEPLPDTSAMDMALDAAALIPGIGGVALAIQAAREKDREKERIAAKQQLKTDRSEGREAARKDIAREEEEIREIHRARLEIIDEEFAQGKASRADAIEKAELAKKDLSDAIAKLDVDREGLKVKADANKLTVMGQRSLQLQLETESAIADQEGRSSDAQLHRLRAKFEGRFAQARSDEERDTITNLHSLAQEALLRKAIADEEKRLKDAAGVARPDISTGSISTALGSFTIAMPEADRLGKQQVTIQSEMLENLKNLLREVMKSRQTGGAFLLAS